MNAKTPVEIEYLRKSNRIIAESFEKVQEMIQPGVTTAEIDAVVEEHILRKGGRPAFKGYKISPFIPPFPAAACVSVNDEVIHGIPGKRVIQDGDIVSVDVGVELSGYFGDSARTYLVGNVSKEVRQLSDDTKEALKRAIAALKPGVYLNEIGKAIEFYLRPKGYGIVRDYCGHGVGKSVHEPPPILHYYDPKRKGPRLKKGMVLAIEPMITLGSHEVVLLRDDWTVATADGSLAAHWEHSIIITEDGAEILSTL